MTDNVRQQAPKVWEQIQKAKNVLLSCHRGPDGDSYGSVLAMKQVLEVLGKKATALAGDDRKLRPFASFPGFESLVDKNFCEIKVKDYDLFLILDSASPDQISRKGAVTFPADLRTVVIDHHPTNEMFGEINLVDTTYPATCQMLYDLFREWGVDINPSIAVCLFVGMSTDTGGFKYPGTTAGTLFAAADLAKINPDFPQLLFEIENSTSPNELIWLRLALGSIETFFGGNVAISSVRFQDLKANGLSRDEVHGAELANILKSVVGWNIGIALSEKETGQVDVSMRTRDARKFDLSKLAVDLGGGGLKAAAGTTIKKPLAEAKKDILASIQKIFPELGTP